MEVTHIPASGGESCRSRLTDGQRGGHKSQTDTLQGVQEILSALLMTPLTLIALNSEDI